MPTVDSLSPTLDFWSWRAEGACQYHPEELFFHRDDERKGIRRQKEEIAKQVCAHCPVLTQCRDHALRAGEHYGVWGGLTERERERMQRRPGAGSPGQVTPGDGDATRN